VVQIALGKDAKEEWDSIVKTKLFISDAVKNIKKRILITTIIIIAYRTYSNKHCSAY